MMCLLMLAIKTPLPLKVTKKIKLLAENELDTLGFTERSTKKIEIYLAFDKLNSEKSISKSLEELDHKDNFYNRWLFKRAIAVDKVMT